MLLVMTMTDTDLVECACGCGEMVTRSKRSKDGRSWKRGHYLRAGNGKLTPLPGPDDDLDEADDPDDIDVGEAIPDGVDFDVPDWLSEDSGPPEPEPELTADRPPGRLGQPRRAGDRRQPAASRGKVRLTKAVRDDVHAKIRVVLMPAGKMWQIRDPLCGATFVAQEPDISEALAEIVCDSPDLLTWFTGPAGGFMKYFKLVMAIQPVALTVWMHHIAHGVQVPPKGVAQQPPQMPAYAA